jgi:hypothetical protein
MRTRFNSSRVLTILALSLTAVFLMSAEGDAQNEEKGLSAAAFAELADAGVFDYLGDFTPVVSSDVGEGWTQHGFNPDYDATGSPQGPVCISGTPYSVFTKAGDPEKLLIFLQGGGACWQGLYRCQPVATDTNLGGGIVIPGQAPGEDAVFFGKLGVFDSSNPDNPFADYSIVYMPYCDGSAFGGDNEVSDPFWNGTTGGTFPLTGQQKRFHYGVRNVSAGMDVADVTFPDAKQITVMGHSAGGVGVAAFAPFLARAIYGNKKTDLTVFNDAGPIVVNLDAANAVQARADDWQFDRFYPASCDECNASGQQTAIVEWRLDNDSTIREAFYETDGDSTNIGFASANLPGFFDPLPPIIPFPDGLSQIQYRELILTEHGALNDAHPKRYKRFIVSGDNTHGGVQGTAGTSGCFPQRPFLFYEQEANGVLLNEWTREFILNGDGDSQFGWKDIVEDYVPVNCPLP